MPGRRGGLSVISVVAAGGVPTSRVINGTSPIRVNGGASADLSGDVTLSILPATTSSPGSMSAADKTLLDSITSTSVTSPRYIASADGSASAPAFARAAGRGIYFDATKGLVFAEGSVDRMMLRVNGDAEIVSTQPYANLRLVNTVGSAVIVTYQGTPEGAISAPVGSFAMDRTNGRLYVKRTGTGNTGWRLVEASESGTYTPTYTVVTNLDSVVANGVVHYMRVGDQVAVTGRCTIDPTASGPVSYRIALPIASNLASGADCLGLVIGGTAFVGQVIGDATNDASQANAANTVTTAYDSYFSFIYTVI